MATKPVYNAYVALSAGSANSFKFSDFDGMTKHTLNLTKSRYESLPYLRAVVTKDGYADGQANLTSLPPFETARSNGIDMTVSIEPYISSNFSISPETFVFPSTGGTQEFMVTCPDNTWDIYSNSLHSEMRATRGESGVTITCNSGSYALPQATLTIRWYHSSLGWQYRNIMVSRSEAESVDAVVFTGKVYNPGVEVIGGGLAGIASADVQVLYKTDNLSPLMILGSGITDSGGNYSISCDIDERLWDDIIQISLTSEKVNYTNGVVSPTTLPSYSEAVANGIAYNIPMNFDI